MTICFIFYLISFPIINAQIHLLASLGFRMRNSLFFIRNKAFIRNVRMRIVEKGSFSSSIICQIGLDEYKHQKYDKSR